MRGSTLALSAVRRRRDNAPPSVGRSARRAPQRTLERDAGAPGKPRRRRHNLRHHVEVPVFGAAIGLHWDGFCDLEAELGCRSLPCFLGLDVTLTAPGDK